MCKVFENSLVRYSSPPVKAKLNEVKMYNSSEHGTYLFRKREHIDKIHCISSGIVRLVNEESDDRYGIAMPGDLIDLNSFFNGSIYQASGLANGPVETCSFPADMFRQLLDIDELFQNRLIEETNKNTLETERYSWLHALRNI